MGKAAILATQRQSTCYKRPDQVSCESLELDKMPPPLGWNDWWRSKILLSDPVSCLAPALATVHCQLSTSRIIRDHEKARITIRPWARPAIAASEEWLSICSISLKQGPLEHVEMAFRTSISTSISINQPSVAANYYSQTQISHFATNFDNIPSYDPRNVSNVSDMYVMLV